MSSSLQLPAKYKSVPSLEALQRRAQGLMSRNRELSREVKGSVGTVESLGLTQLGAALHGIAIARGWTPEAVGIAGGAFAAFGLAFGQSSAVHAANGLLAPLTAGMAMKWYATTMQSNSG